MIDWQQTHAALWRGRSQSLRPARALDPIDLAALVGIEAQKQALLASTERFLEGAPAPHALLWGARGTGKSSLVKAIFNALRPRGLRLVEVDRNDLADLPELLERLPDRYRFILFLDDLSFGRGDDDDRYRALKRVLEGSIEPPPPHVRVYATSNRRHLLPEHLGDNATVQLLDGELHYGDAVEEKLSLADRFGLWLSFYPFSMGDYLALVRAHGTTDEDEARAFAQARAAHSGRTARQFLEICGLRPGKSP